MDIGKQSWIVYIFLISISLLKLLFKNIIYNYQANGLNKV